MPTIKPIARPYWSGVEKFDFDFPKSELTRLVELIPVPKQLNETETRSRCNRISIKLIELGARFQRNLHQDEFGPRRPDQAEGLRFLLKQLEGLAKGAEDEILDRIADILDSLDSSAHGELFDDACGAGLDITALRDEAAPRRANEEARDSEESPAPDYQSIVSGKRTQSGQIPSYSDQSAGGALERRN